LVYPLLLPLGEAMNRRLRILLKTEAEYFSDYEVKELEQKFELSAGSLLLNGRIDRVSLFRGGPVIIDYKTNNAPSRSMSRRKEGAVEEVGLEDFQIPMYIKLYEAAHHRKVDKAFFMIIHRHEIVPIMGDLPGKRDLLSRDEYKPSMEALERGIGIFDSAVSSLNFNPRGMGGIPGSPRISYRSCASCTFKTICRYTYSLNPRLTVYGKPALVEEEEYTEEEEDIVF
jgi:ATP-dependent helicase/DNAse subunit B